MRIAQERFWDNPPLNTFLFMPVPTSENTVSLDRQDIKSMFSRTATWDRVQDLSVSHSVRPEHDKGSFTASKWDCLYFQRKYSPNKAMSLCCVSPAIHEADTGIVCITKSPGKPASYTGLVKCHGYWCPVCAYSNRVEKVDRLRAGLSKALSQGFKAYFVTYTINRQIGTIKEKVDALQGSYRKLINRLRNKAKRDKFSLYFSKTLDVTIHDRSINPYHLHIHSVVITDRKIDGLEDWVFDRYKKLIDKEGFDVRKCAFDFKEIKETEGISSYLNKTYDISKEMNTTNKSGSIHNSLGWFKWISCISRKPILKQIEIYRDFLAAMKGRRTIDFSRNWKELIEDVESCDIETEIDESKDIRLFIGLNLWEAIKTERLEAKVLLLVDKAIQNKKFIKNFELLKELCRLSISPAPHLANQMKILRYQGILKILFG